MGRDFTATNKDGKTKFFAILEEAFIPLIGSQPSLRDSPKKHVPAYLPKVPVQTRGSGVIGRMNNTAQNMDIKTEHSFNQYYL